MRVCLYDRPSTTAGQNIEEPGGQLSTPAPQPHLLEDDVADLRSLLTAADELGPKGILPSRKVARGPNPAGGATRGKAR